jgi:AraC-like DNA-binding protein
MNRPVELQPLRLADKDFWCRTGWYQSSQIKRDQSAPMPHIHDCYEVYLNISGGALFLINGKMYAVESGDIIIVRPGQMHVCIVQNSCMYEEYCFWFLPRRTTALLDFADREDMHCHIRFQQSEREKLISIFSQLYAAECMEREIQRTACVYELLAILNDPAEPERVSVPGQLPKAFQQVLTYINNQFAQISTVQEITDHFYISTATLTRWFRENLQISPKDYLNTRRLAYSKELLKQRLSVTETCDMAGFPNCSRFIAVFKKTFGITPLQYQKQMIKQDIYIEALWCGKNDIV